MAIGDTVGKIQTVLGPINPEELGVTLTHEHLLTDLEGVYGPPPEAHAREIYYRPVSRDDPNYMETISLIRYQFYRVADNMKLLSVNDAIEEIMLFKQYGGNSIVEVTGGDIGRDPIGLMRISRATGLNILMGSSHYVDDCHPANMDEMSEEEITQNIVREVAEGVGETGIRPGLIGEVGCSWPLTENERKVLRASGRAQRQTGAPLNIHPGRDNSAPLEIIEILSEVGTNLGQTTISHIDRTVFEKSTLKQVAESGCYMEWDLFGREQSHYFANLDIDMPSDAVRMDDIAWIGEQGYADQVVIAHDICSKDRLLKNGGHGYHYILAHILPRMRYRGYSDEAIDRILVENPARSMTFSEPKD